MTITHFLSTSLHSVAFPKCIFLHGNFQMFWTNAYASPADPGYRFSGGSGEVVHNVLCNVLKYNANLPCMRFNGGR